MKRHLAILSLFPLLLCNCGNSPLPRPTDAQLAWQDMEMNMFCHFGPNTFSGLEWGDGTEPEDIFAPTALDCRQWAATARAAGFRGIIITAKHHDGFCLWPNPESSHTVAQSAWKEGKGDVLADLSAACREYGLKFGVYISPWDRHDPRYGTPEYNDVFVKTLESVHSGAYGHVFEQWFDGANGEGPGGRRQEYDWPRFNAAVYRYNPDAVIFSDVGPGCRWVGNESGSAGETCWSYLSPEGFEPGAGAPSVDTLNCGQRGGSAWIPAETDVSIRPGWFWKASETPRLKTVEQLVDIYFRSVGRNSLLLLNVPPDTRGLIDPADSLRLMEFRSELDRIFSCDLAAGGRLRAHGKKEYILKLDSPATFNLLVLEEDIARGQKIAAFSVEALEDGSWTEVATGTTVGRKRILEVPKTTSGTLRIRIPDCITNAPSLKAIHLFLR